MRASLLSEIALKTWAVFVLAGTLVSLSGILGQFAAASGGAADAATWRIASTWNTVGLAMSVITALAVLKFARPVTLRMFPSDDVVSGLRSDHLEKVAFGTIGVYFLVAGLREVAVLGYELLTRPEFENSATSYLWHNQPQNLVIAITNLLAGLILILGRSGFSAAWSRLRGVQTTEPDEVV